MNFLFSELDSETEAALQRLGISTTGLLGLRRSIRVTERYIASGDPIYMLGEISNQGGRKVITSGPAGSLIISDRSERALLVSLCLNVALRIIGMIAVTWVGILVLNSIH